MPAIVKRFMMLIFSEFLEYIMEFFTDGFSSFKDCLANLERVLERCDIVNLVLDCKKCNFMVNDDIYWTSSVCEGDKGLQGKNKVHGEANALFPLSE